MASRASQNALVRRPARPERTLAPRARSESPLDEAPCSYLIYSSAFDALPPSAKDPIYKRLWEVLSGEEQGERTAPPSRSPTVKRSRRFCETPRRTCRRIFKLWRNRTGSDPTSEMHVRAAEPTEIDPLAQLWFDGWHEAHAHLVPPPLTRVRTLTNFREGFVPRSRIFVSSVSPVRRRVSAS